MNLNQFFYLTKRDFTRWVYWNTYIENNLTMREFIHMKKLNIKRKLENHLKYKSFLHPEKLCKVKKKKKRMRKEDNIEP